MLLCDAPSGDTAHTLTEEPARGLKIKQMNPTAATLFYLRAGKLARLVACSRSEDAFTDIDPEE
jgi:hypothetical protein